MKSPPSHVFVTALDRGHTFDYPTFALERALRDELGIPSVVNLRSDASIFLAKGLARLRFMRSILRRPPTYIVPVHRLAEFNTFPVCWTHRIVPWSFDVWPSAWDRWESMYRRHRVDVAFITARESAQEMQKRRPNMRAIWLPEAADPNEYDPSVPQSRRSIDVLELGRSLAKFHQSVAQSLAKKGVRHVYAGSLGRTLFPTRQDLIRAMAQTRLNVCFPGTMTHPELFGGLETATYRYFESFASKCVVLGHAPAELIDLFGFNPVIECDLDHAAEQIFGLLDDIDGLQAHADRVHARFLEVGTWQVRARAIADALGIQSRSPTDQPPMA